MSILIHLAVMIFVITYSMGTARIFSDVAKGGVVNVLNRRTRDLIMLNLGVEGRSERSKLLFSLILVLVAIFRVLILGFILSSLMQNDIIWS